MNNAESETPKTLPSFFSKILSKFFGNRMPLGAKVTLSQRSSYIWPIAPGYFLLGIVLLMMVGATNYQNNLAFLLSFLVIGVGLSAIVLTYKNLQGIEFSMQSEADFFVERTGHVTLALKSLTGNNHSAVGLGWGTRESLYTNVPDEGIQRIRLALTPLKRGYVNIPRVRVSSIFPFGWFRVWGYFKLSNPILVYPEPIEPPQMTQDSGQNDFEEGVKTAGSDEFYGLKQYQAGEPLSRIDWKSYARERGVYVREFANYQGRQLCFDWQFFEGYPVESRISFLTFMVEQAALQNLGYSLKIPGTFLAFDEGEKHRKACLKALALFNSESSQTNEDLFAELSKNQRAL